MRPRRSAGSFARIGGALALAAWCALGAPHAARAQDFEIGRSYRVADHDELRALVQRVTEALAAKRDADAVDALDRLLARTRDGGLVVQVPSTGTARFEGAEIAARRLFDALPPSALAEWERRHRADAEALLERGVRLRRTDDLAEAARLYPLRDVRRRAHEALAELQLVRGEFARAAHQLRELLAVTDTPAEKANVFARLAFALAQRGDRAGVDRVRTLATAVLGEAVPGPEGAEPLFAFVERMQRLAGPGRARGAWPTFGGDEHGSAVADAPPRPEAKPRWEIASGYQQGTETNDDQSWGRRREDTAHRPVAPVVANGIVYVSDGLRLRAVDLSSGRLLWQADTRQRAPVWRDNVQALFAPTVADGVVYAALATRSDAPQMDRVFFGHIIVYSRPHRALGAWDARSGEKLWSLADEDIVGRPDAEYVTHESVAAPPLVVGDDVIVAVWTYVSDFDVRLVCLDRHTGRLRWRRSIAQGQQELNLFGRPVKELATSPLAELDGVVYLATGLGVAAAVRVEDGRVEWLAAYPQTAIPPSQYWYETRERAVHFRPSPVAATRTTVVMAPPESPYVLGLDPRDGSTRWRVGTNAPVYSFERLLGVASGRAYLLGRRLAAIDLESGERVWTEREAGQLLGAGGEPVDGAAVGAGVVTADAVYVPLADGVAICDPSSGRQTDFWPLPPRPPSDLVSADSALLLVARNRIAAHYRYEERRDRLLARIAKAPDDPRLRLEAGEVFRSAGRLDDAASSLETGMRHLDGLAPQARERVEAALRAALFATYLDRAQEAVVGGAARAAIEDLRRAVDVAPERGDAVRALLQIAECDAGAAGDAALGRVRSEFPDVRVTLAGTGRVHAAAFAAFRLADRRIGAGDVAGAVALWLDLLEAHADEDLGRTDVRGAVGERLAAARRAHGDVVDAQVRARAERAFGVARDAGDAAALERVVRTYPDARTQADAGLLAARLYLDSGDARSAAALLRLLASAEVAPADAARALWLLADAFRASADTSGERLTLQRLRREYPEESLDGVRVADAVRERLADPRLAGPSQDLPAPQPPLQMLWDVSAGDGRGAGLVLVSLEGSVPASLGARLVALQSSSLVLLDAASGRAEWRVPTDLDARRLTATDDALVVIGEAQRPSTGTVVRAFALADGSRLWSRAVEGLYRESTAAQGLAYVLHTGDEDDGASTYLLTAIDLQSGLVAASRELADRPVADMLVSDGAVIVPTASPSSARESILSSYDATTLALRGTTPASTPFARALAAVPGTGLAVALRDERTLIGVDLATGTERWSHDTGKRINALFGSGARVVAALDPNAVACLDAATGEVAWEHDLGTDGDLGWQGLAVADGLVAAVLTPPDAADRVLALALDAASGERLWQTAIPGVGVGVPRASPHVCRDVVAVEVNERGPGRTYRCRVVLLDRARGTQADLLEHPEIGRNWQQVVYDRGYVALTYLGALAVYGGAPR